MGKPDEFIEADTTSVMEFYADLIETSNNYLKYYLSEDVVLDWFGRTVKGQKTVAAFIKDNVHPIKHFPQEIKPVQKIGFRTSHQFKTSSTSRRVLRSSFISPPRISLLNTPKKQKPPLAQPSTSKSVTKRSLSKSLFNQNTDHDTNADDDDENINRIKKPKLSPPAADDTTDISILKSEENGENSFSSISNVKYLTADGSIEFHRSSTKKLLKETKWQRQCKVHLAYDCGKDVRDSLFYLIIYEDNVKCRRNLMKDFSAPAKIEDDETN